MNRRNEGERREDERDGDGDERRCINEKEVKKIISMVK